MINRAVRMNYNTNLLELEEHMYPLVDVETPNVFHKDVYKRQGLSAAFWIKTDTRKFQLCPML